MDGGVANGKGCLVELKYGGWGSVSHSHKLQLHHGRPFGLIGVLGSLMGRWLQDTLPHDAGTGQYTAVHSH